MTAKIIFANGTELAAELNGTCLICDQKPAFPADLSIVTVVSKMATKTYRNAYVQECASVDGRYWFAFIEESAAERTIRELQEQNQMLTDCILEMSEIIYGGDV